MGLSTVEIYTGAPTSGSVQDLYTAPASTTAIIKEILVSNPNSVRGSFDMYRIPSGVSAASKQMFSSVVVEPNDTKILQLSTVLETTSKLSVEVLEGSLTFIISGTEEV